MALLFGLLVPAPTFATSDAVIGFDDTGAAGQLVTDQYQAQGVRLGHAADFNRPTPGSFDCGSPTIVAAQSLAFSPPQYARIPQCAVVDQTADGTYGVFDYARGSISVRVRDVSNSGDIPMTLTGYGAQGNVVATASGVAGDAAWTQLAVTAGPAQISSFAIYRAGTGSGLLAMDDLRFDHGGAPLALTGRSLTAVSGSALSATVGHLTDGDPTATASDFTATVGWGDGGQASAQVVSAPGGGFDVVASHTYAKTGQYAATVSANKVNGRTATATDPVVVSATPLRAPVASFTSTAPAATLPVKLDASATHAPGTVPVLSYGWHVSGANTASFTCGGGTSGVQLFLPRSGVNAITLTVSDTTGNVTQVQQSISGLGARFTPKHRSPLVNSSAVIGFCIPGLNDPPVDVSTNGGPPAGCNQTLQVGLTEAVGCFREVTQGKDVPAAEAAILNQQPEWTETAGTNPDFAGTGARAARSSPTLVGRITNPFFLGYFATPFVSDKTVRINGLDYIPHNGARILVVPRLSLIISSDATVALGTIPVGNGQIAEKVPFEHADSRVHVDDYQLSKLADKIGVAGLPFDGRMSVDFLYHRAELTAQITLPNFFATDGGDPFNATVVLHTDNHSGLKLDQIHLGPLNADIVGLGFKDVRFDYDAQTKDWDAQGKLDLFGTVAIDAAPPPDEYGVHFRGGEFKSAGAAADFGDSGIPIFPGLTLNRIGVALGLNPTLFIGDIGLRALELAQIDGRVIVALPSDDAPYTLTTGDAGDQFAQIAGRTFTNSPTIGVGGSLGLAVPGLDTVIPLANAYFLYSYPSYVAFGGGFRYGVDGLNINGGVNGEFNLARDEFNVEGHVQLDLPDPLPGFGAAAIVSSKGIAACGSGYVFPYGHIVLGAGYHWGGGVVIWLGNCNLGEFRQTVQTAALRATPGGTSFTLPAGLPSAEVRVGGLGDAPIITVHAPDGETLTAPTDRLAKSGHLLIVRTPKLQTTWIGIEHPVAGTYTVTAEPGSATVTSLATARGLAGPSVTATISGSGTHRVLGYSVLPRAGQSVTFIEGSHVIGTINGGGKGALRFAPAAGALGQRAVIAQISLNGMPSTNITVAHFRATRPPPLRRVKLRVRRGGTTLRITWTGTAGAERYAIDIHGNDGRVRAFTVSSHRRSLLSKGLPRSVAGLVTITALRRRDHGPRATAGFRATGTLRTGIHPLHKPRRA